MVVISKRVIMITGAFLILFSTFLTVTVAMRSLPKTATVDTSFKMVIDAGHGGIDGGVSGKSTGVKESDINLSLAKKIAKKSSEYGYLTVLTRSSSAGLYGTATSSRKKKDMQKRKDIINEEKPDIVISVHMNFYPSSERKGAQVFYNKNSTASKNLAEVLQKNLNTLPTNSRAYSALVGDYYMLNCSNYPTVIVECGFLSNPEDEALLITDDYQELLADKILVAVSEYRALKVLAN